MSTVNADSTTKNPAASSELQRGADEAHTGEELGPFKPWPAIRVIEARLSGIVQLIAIHLARRSPKYGNLEPPLFVQKNIAKWAGCSSRTVRRAMETIVASGLLVVVKRKREGYVYTWGRDAYCPPDVAAKLDISCSPANGETSTPNGATSWDAIHHSDIERWLVERYLAKRQKKYGAPGGLPSSLRKAQLSVSSARAIIPDLVWAAKKRNDCEKPVDAIVATIELVLELYFRNPGADGKWLRDNEHPLEVMHRDLATIMSQVFRHKAYREPVIDSESSVPRIDIAAANVSAHKCECGEQATRIWYSPTGSIYSCVKRECSPAAKLEVPRETRLGENQHGPVGLPEVQRGPETEAASLEQPVVDRVLDSRPRFDPAKMPTVSRQSDTGKPILKPVVALSPEASRVKAIMAKYPKFEAVPDHVVQGLLEVTSADNLTLILRRAAKACDSGLPPAKLAAWLFKFVLQNNTAAAAA